MSDFSNLFAPLPIGNAVSLPNRILMGPMTLNQATESGHITDWIVDWYERRAAGGTGTLIGAAAFVSQNGRGWANAMGIADDSYTAGWKRCADAAHAHGALFGPQLFHAGAASRVALLGHAPLCPSEWTREGFDPAREMTSNEIEQVIDDFASATRRAVVAGCDFVEIHGAHGYLVHQFWREDVNRRSDRWGDPLAFPTEIARAVRANLPSNAPLLYRFSIHADDPAAPNQPVTPTSLGCFLKSLEGAGVDAWDISCWHESRRGYFGTDRLLPDHVRDHSALPRIVAGNLLTPKDASEYIAEGHAEAVALARALIVDAQWVSKARHGTPGEIRPVDGDAWRVIQSGVDPGV